ncbi:MAG: Structural maintenance of chromosomes protein 1 [Vezdaea aestivalis]|nr:MAG: Structural maintenance of chromosomes protein 1 [Vezdaea aestivalis]
MGKLIRLELYNFKSYKGHHVLLFGDSYFTSIIGPNGSGKSNSMDAISFVLGIKSSHLRSTHLRDLVYRGRVLRTSTIHDDGSATTPATNGQANGHAGSDDEGTQNGTQRSQSERSDPKTAWVTAVYEDDAGDEQMWKRSITSQGVSEYRINNRVVSAQQYNDALETENILIKARNFLVFQGDVEAIASQSPKDLTKLIEQISGSLEHKSEYERLKGETESANEHQTFNLNRRRGINTEIKQYQEQKREAENYTKKSEDRDQAIVNHALWKLYHFHRVMDGATTEIQNHQEELKEFRRGIEKYEQNLDLARKEQARVGREVGKAERSIRAKEDQIQEKENSLVPIDEKIEISLGKVKKYEARVSDVDGDRQKQSSAVDHLKSQQVLVDKAQSRWEEDWKRMTKQQGRQLDESDVQEYHKLREKVNTRTSADQGQAETLSRQVKTMEETVQSISSKYESAQWQSEKLEEDMAELTLRKDHTNGQIKTTLQEVDAKKKEFHTLTSERLRTAQKQTELEEKFREVLNKLLEADDGRRQSEKELRIKETISMLRRIYPGVRGRVSDLCKPTMKKYGDAVSTVLGRHFDAVIVDNEKTAKDCIQYLRDQRAGQATFIPLDTIQVTPINSNLKNINRARLAIDTIEFDNSVERAMLYACGNAIVCDDLGIAKNIVYDKGIEAKAVTLDGTVIHKGGLMTGGRGPGRQNSRRWEDAEVEALRKLKDNLHKELESLPKANRRGAAEEGLQADLTGLDQRLHFAREEVKALEKNLASKKKELDFAKRQQREFKPQYDQESKKLETLKNQLENSRAAVSKVEDEIFNDFCKRLKYDDIRSYEAQQGSLQQEAAQKKLEFTMQKNKLQNQLSFESQRLNATIERIQKLETQSRIDSDLIAQLQKEKALIRKETTKLKAERSQAYQVLEAARAEHETKAEMVAEYRRDVQSRSKEAEGTLKSISGLETEIQRNAANRYALLRRCKLEEIDIPLTEDSTGLDRLPVDDMLQTDPDKMDVDDEDPSASALQPPVIQDYGIEVDFEDLDEDLKEDSSTKCEEGLQEKIGTLSAEMEKMAPNMRAIERLEGVETRLKSTEKDFDDARRRAKQARDQFSEVKETRHELFMKAFNHISEQIGQVYKDLTKTATLPLGGQAYLDIEDSEEPYNEGIKYHAMPPLKRFRDMEHLSGGEKTMAALALLFAVHSYQPSPFFVLDEVDAALDNANVQKIASYIREHAGPGMQFIVISLKTGLFQGSEALIGIYRDQSANSSKPLTLDLRKYQ